MNNLELSRKAMNDIAFYLNTMKWTKEELLDALCDGGSLVTMGYDDNDVSLVEEMYTLLKEGRENGNTKTKKN